MPLHILQVSYKTANGLRFENAENETISDRTSVNDVFSLHRYEKITRDLSVLCVKRGYYRILSTSVQGSDLFSQQIHYREYPQTTGLFVLPGRLSAERYSLPVSRLFGDIVVRRSLFEDNLSVRGIRSYTNTDPESSINWKATAHTGDLKVNLHDRTAGQRLTILLNVEAPSALYNEDLLEDSIRLAGTLTEESQLYDIPIRLITNGIDILSEDDHPSETNTSGLNQTGFGASAGHVRSVLELLARIDLTKEAAPFADILEAVLAEEQSMRDGVCHIVISTSIREHTTSALKDFSHKVHGITWLSPVSPDMPEPPLTEADVSDIDYVRMVRR